MSAAACKIILNGDTQAALAELSRKLRQFDYLVNRATRSPKLVESFIERATSLDRNIQDVLAPLTVKYSSLVSEFANVVD